MDSGVEGIIRQRLDVIMSANPLDTWKTALEIVKKFLANILYRPYDPKFRALRKSNTVIQAKLLPCVGVLQLFSDLGFTPMDDSLIFVGNEMHGLERAVGIVETVLETAREAEKQRNEVRKVNPPSTNWGEMSEERRRIVQQFRDDREESKLRHAPSCGSKAVDMKPGGKQATFKDIGVDINKKGG